MHREESKLSDPLGGKIYVTGDRKEVARVEEILRLVDVSSGAEGEAGSSAPKLVVYPVAGIEADLVVKVLQTMLTGVPGAFSTRIDSTLFGSVLAFASAA